MAKQSAGLLMYRRREGSWEVLLVHPGGPFWARKDEGAWTIPKGEIEEGEDAFAAARREFEEETGCKPEGEFRPLSPVRLKSRKTVRAWAFEGDWDPGMLTSMIFTVEWPPHSGKIREYPEADAAGWFSLEEAREKIQAGQMGFIEELEQMTRTKLAEG
jgi:predicted NUDIX family NTP pyrophosphohydrolase